MKLIGLSALLIATTLNVQAGQPLKSNSIKELLCSDLEAKVYDDLTKIDEVNTHNGDAGIYSVDSSYTFKKLVQELEESLENYGDPQTDREYDYCVYFTETDTKSVIDYMGDYSSDLETLLLQMKKKGQIKGAAFRGYEDGASEYCSNFYFRILTNDGKVIYVDFDFTT